MVAPATSFLALQLDAYARGWQDDRHVDALAAGELESRLKTALALFDHVRRIDHDMTHAAAAGNGTWDAASTERLFAFYREWEAPTARIAARIGQLEAAGARVDGAAAFKRATLQARSVLNTSIEQLERSARDARAGNVRPWAEIRDELRRQADAGR
jgi:hypothetical protein